MILKAQNLTSNSCIFHKKTSISPIFVCQELGDDGGGRLLEHGHLFEYGTSMALHGNPTFV